MYTSNAAVVVLPWSGRSKPILAARKHGSLINYDTTRLHVRWVGTCTENCRPLTHGGKLFIVERATLVAK